MPWEKEPLKQIKKPDKQAKSVFLRILNRIKVFREYLLIKRNRDLLVLFFLSICIITGGYLLLKEPKIDHFTNGNDPAQGLHYSPLVINAYLDFQSTLSGRSYFVFKKVMRKYRKKVEFVFNDFPLVIVHSNSFKASVSASCADSQGKFWEYYDLLFLKREDWFNEDSVDGYFEEYADSLSLDMDEFRSCIKDDHIKEMIYEDVEEAKNLGSVSAPVFFIGEDKISGSYDFEYWDLLIKSYLNDLEL